MLAYLTSKREALINNGWKQEYAIAADLTVIGEIGIQIRPLRTKKMFHILQKKCTMKTVKFG
jgi:hypothetical protein